MAAPNPVDFAALAAEIAAQLKGFRGSLDQLAGIWRDSLEKITTPFSESSRVPVKELQVYNRPLRLQCALVYNTNAALRWAQFHNSVSTVREGSTADVILPVAGQNTASLDFRQGPFFSNGLYVCGSTADATKTLITSNDLIIFCTFARA